MIYVEKNTEYEILIIYVKNKNIGHYVKTPYSYLEDISKKYIQTLYTNIGEGIIQLINEIKQKKIL